MITLKISAEYLPGLGEITTQVPTVRVKNQKLGVQSFSYISGSTNSRKVVTTSC